MSASFEVAGDRLVPIEGPSPAALVHGYGVFEAVRVYGGEPFELGAHLARMREGAERLLLAEPPSDERIERLCAGAIETAGLAEARLRLVWAATAGGAELWSQAGPLAASLLIQLEPIPNRLQKLRNSGVDVIVGSHRVNERSLTAGVKTIGYAAHILAKREAMEAGAYEALILDCEGHVVEGSMSNVFALVEGKLLTPPLELGPLPGVTRHLVLELARESGLEAGEQPFKPGLLSSAEECFLTGTVAELMPVVRVDCTVVGGGRPGEVTRRLQAAYAELTKVGDVG
ncbi:MAG: branched-chain amino acid aminotransferase [Actinobacteria bacterium]|nr:MAG: branched-chain amino acid aminotransferase [Actinomycetota bacterium]